MRDFLELIKKHFTTTIMLVLVLLFSIVLMPLIINLLFKSPALCSIFIAEWEASDALSYYGEVLAFIGTTFLSILALWQNHIIQKSNDKHTMILEQMERDKIVPFLAIKDVTVYGQGANMTLSILNVSGNLAQDIDFYDFSIKTPTNVYEWKSDKSWHTNYLSYNDTYQIKLTNPPIKDCNYCITFKIKYYDTFGTKHICTATGTGGQDSFVPSLRIYEDKK